MIDLTLFAQQGYDAEEDATVEFTHGSSAFVAWRVGRWQVSLKGLLEF